MKYKEWKPNKEITSGEWKYTLVGCYKSGSDNRPKENNSSSMIINGKYSENVEYGTRIEIGKMKGGE